MRRHPKPDPKAVRREYERLASVYDRRWSAYVWATTQESLKRLHPAAGDRLLDVGCGTGALLEAAAKAFPQTVLVGVDPVPAMLKQARRKSMAGVRFVLGWAESLPFAAASFDVVVSCNTFHYWRKPAVGLSEIRRVLRPGGRLVITDWCHDYLTCRICDLFLRTFNRTHHKTYGSGECEKMLAAAGFEDIVLERYRVGLLWGMMTATCRAAGDACPLCQDRCRVL